MEAQESEKLYIDLKRKLCDLIYQGTYDEGERIPPERVLTEQFGVSRITVRKTLELLEREGLVIREIGRGTTISFHNRGFAGNLDMAALVAPARSTFFSEFIEYFQKHLEERHTLLLYVQKPEKETMEHCLYRLYQKDIRNVVVWPDDAPVNQETLRRLRALGMNMVFFDTDVAMPYADCVYLDNHKAVMQLLDTLGRNAHRQVCYIGWDNTAVFSVRERARSFQAYKADAPCIALSWDKREKLKSQIEVVSEYLKEAEGTCDFLCGSGEIGVETAKILRRIKRTDCQVATVDEFPDAKRLKITACRQDFARIAECIFDCLERQNAKEQSWKASCRPITGELRIH